MKQQLKSSESPMESNTFREGHLFLDAKSEEFQFHSSTGRSTPLKFFSWNLKMMGFSNRHLLFPAAVFSVNHVVKLQGLHFQQEKMLQKPLIARREPLLGRRHASFLLGSSSAFHGAIGVDIIG